MEKPLIYLLFFLVLCFYSLPSSASPRRSYGELCNKTVNVKCDRRAGLSCGPDGNCDCSRPDEMIYVKRLGKCVTRAGETCKFVLELSGNLGDQDEIVYRFEDCVPSAYCASNGFCSCNEATHFETINGTCDSLRNHSESCDTVEKCDGSKGLVCGEKGICQCTKQATEVKSNSTLKIIPVTNTNVQCVGLAGEICINSKCTPNASCSSSSTSSSLNRNHISSGLNQSGICTCKVGFFQTDDGKCLLKLVHHQPCNKSEQCGPSVTECLEGVCTCDPTRSIYGEGRRTQYPERAREHSYDGFVSYYPRSQCLGLAGSPCIDGYCSKKAYCNYVYGNNAFSLQNFNGTCACQSSYYPCRKTGLCKLGFEGQCKLTSDCVEGLVCRRKKCDCPFQGQIFRGSFSYNLPSLCTSKVRGPCRADVECQDDVMKCLGVNEEATWTLTFNKTRAQIVPGDRKAETSGGHCFCKDGFVENVNRTCDLKFGQSCDDNKKQCDSIAGLVCVNNLCSCGGFDDFNHELRRCEGLVGASCQLVQQDQLSNGKCPSETETRTRSQNEYGSAEEKKKSPCGRNMDCVPWFPGHPLITVDDGGYCTCKSGFSETSNYTCEATEILNDSGNSSEEIQNIAGGNNTTKI